VRGSARCGRTATCSRSPQRGRLTFQAAVPGRELIEQFWFIASVTILPSALVLDPRSRGDRACSLGSLTQQLGAESFTERGQRARRRPAASPLIVALLIAGAAARRSARTSAPVRSARKWNAMRVMGVSPIQRLNRAAVLAVLDVSSRSCSTGWCRSSRARATSSTCSCSTHARRLPVQFAALAQLPDMYIARSRRDLRLHRRGDRRAPRPESQARPKGVGEAVSRQWSSPSCCCSS